MTRRLTLVIHSLAQGGAERDMAHLARHWVQHGNDVTLVTLDSARNDSFELPPQLERIGLDLMGTSQNPLQAFSNNRLRIRALRDVLRNRSPQTVISFIDRMNVVTLMAAKHLPDPVIVSERIDPRHHDPGRAWRWLRRRVYPRCTAQLVLTHSVQEWCRQLAPRRPVYMVPNPARRPETGRGAAGDRTTPGAQLILLGMGRLNPQKGFDRLLPIFARLVTRFPNWTLKILGEGDERSRLEEQVLSLDLADRVSMPGWVADVDTALCQAEVFVLPSRYEGFGNVVAEALACGLPVVTFDCQSGPGEIVRDGIDGLVVPADDSEALEGALEQIMADETLRRQLASRAPEVLERFSEQRFFAQWDAVLDGRTEEYVAAITA